MYNEEDLERQDKILKQYLEEGKYPEALECAFKSLKIAEKLFPSYHGRTGVCLYNIGYLMQINGNLTEAEIYYHKALNIIEKWGGPQNPNLCPSLDSLGILYKEIGRFAEAESLLLRSLTIKRTVYGSFHPELARSLNELGHLYQKQKRFSEAEKNYKEAVEVWQTMGPIIDINYEISVPIINLSETLYAQGDYMKAETYITNGLNLLTQTLPQNHYRLAPFYHSFGKLCCGKGEFSRSLEFYTMSLNVYEENYGPGHPLTIQAMKDIAMTFKFLGEFEKAEACYIKFTTLWSQRYSLNHPDLAPVHSELGHIYEYLGKFEQAEQQHQRSLKIRSDCLNKYHIDIASSLENLGHLNVLQRNFEEAGTYYENARIILENSINARHDNPQLIHNYIAAANNYKNQGQNKKAENYYKKAVVTCESLTAPDPEVYALALGNLGSFYQYISAYEKAAEFIKRALQIRTDQITPNHPENVWLFLHLVALDINRRNFGETISDFRRIMALQDRLCDMVFFFGKELQKVNFIDNLFTIFSAALSFINRFMSKDKESLHFGLETVFWHKGKVVDTESRRSFEAILPVLTTEKIKDIWLSYISKLSSLSRFLLDNAPEIITPIANKKEEIAKLWVEIAELEISLKTTFPTAWLYDRSSITVDKVAATLPENTALLEFVKIRDFDFENIQDPWGLIRYIVFVLKPGGRLKLIDLGRAFDIDQTIARAIQFIQEPLENPENILKQLYKLLWAPLEKQLQGIDKVIISPDGMLNLAPFAALVDEKGGSLVERFTITHVCSGRSIVTPVEKTPVGDNMLVLAADVDFDYQEVIPLKPDPEQEKASSFWFKSLSHTIQEASEIPPLVPGDPSRKKVLLKDKAHKNTILNIKNPRILHLATHGFSFPYHGERFLPLASGFARGLHSLAQMGLAFAGAHYANVEIENDTGLLNIMEIAGMELHGTELVVLSACNPGIGEFMTGEGIFAFKRAFEIAGAKNLVMNLWPINGEYTLLHMKEFYKNLVHWPPAEALRQTQLQMIEHLKKNESYAAQNLWATFIIHGGQALTSNVF